MLVNSYIQLLLQSTRKDEYDFWSLHLCGRTTDFQRMGCYLDLTLTATISSMQNQSQASEGQTQMVPGWQQCENAARPWAGVCPPETRCRDAKCQQRRGGNYSEVGLLYKMSFGCKKWNNPWEKKSFPLISPSSHPRGYIAQNHRTVRVGRDPWRLSGPTPLPR